MAAFDYEGIADTTLSLLEDFGNPFILKHQVGTPKYNPKTKKTDASYEDFSGTGVMTRYEGDAIGRSNNVINAGDMKFICQLDDKSIIPTEFTDKISFMGVVYNIVNKDPINPSGDYAVAYIIQARRIN